MATEKPLSVIDALSLLTRCSYCAAEPGDWCRVAKGRTAGRRAWYLHSDRQWIARTAWYAGVREGYKWSTENVAATLDRDRQWSPIARGEFGDPLDVERVRAYFVRQAESAEKWQIENLARLGDMLGRTIA